MHRVELLAILCRAHRQCSPVDRELLEGSLQHACAQPHSDSGVNTSDQLSRLQLSYHLGNPPVSECAGDFAERPERYRLAATAAAPCQSAQHREGFGREKFPSGESVAR